MTDTEQRLVDLESKLAFLEAHFTELSDTMFAQQKQLDRVEKRLDELRDLALGEHPGQASADEKPPHY